MDELAGNWTDLGKVLIEGMEELPAKRSYACNFLFAAARSVCVELLSLDS